MKVRLGWDSGEKKFEIADAVQQAGATELVVHGRTKEQGYRAEHIDWQAIGEIRQRLDIPVIANGEIWDWQSAQQCMAISGCDAVMIGRGALNIPNLSRVVKYNEPRMPWPEVVALLQKYTLTFSAVRPISISGSTDINSATRVTGNPIAGRTISAAKVAPPPTPATPAELTVTIPTSVAIHIGSSGLMPKKPVVINTFHTGSMLVMRLNQANPIPMMNAPIRFAASVPNGIV